MNHQQQHPLHKFPTPPPFSGGDDHMMMKRSPLEQVLAALLNDNNNNNNDNNNNKGLPSCAPAAARVSGGAGLFEGLNYHQQQQVGPTFVDPTAIANDAGLSFGFKHDHHHHQDIVDGFGGLAGESSPWYQNFTPPQPCVSATIDSQSSICVMGKFGHEAGSPTSTLKPKAGDNQASGSSEDDDLEIEAGPCEQSNEPLDPKRLRRMESNKQSARRSRRRKQAQLQELETQVEVLTGENVTLFKQLGDAAQQLRDATTNHRVLVADVEALKAKVKLAEDRVTRGTMSPNLSHILQTQLGTPPQMLNPHTLSRVDPMSTTMGIRGQDNVSFAGLFSGIVGNNVSDQIMNGNNAKSGLVGSSTDAVSSCASDMWLWESQVSSLSK